MFASDFQANLRKVNSKLRIFCGDDDSKPAGIYYVERGEIIPVCGIDKSYIPEHPIVDERGKLLKGGWRRALRSMIAQKLIDRRRAESVFGTQLLGVRRPITDRVYVNPINKATQDAIVHNMSVTGKPALKRDEIMDLASEITKNAD